MTEVYPEELDIMEDYDGDVYDDIDDLDDDDDDELYDSDYDPDEAEDLIDDLLGEAADGYGDDLGDFFWGKKKRRRRRRNRGRRVNRASRRRSYIPPASSRKVQQRQLKTITDAQDRKIARNASGIKTLTKSVNGMQRRVSGLVRVNTMQTSQIRALRTRLRTDAAIDVATAFEGENIDFGNIARAAAKFGAFDKGAFSNPYLIGGLVLLLQRGNLLGNLFNKGV